MVQGCCKLQPWKPIESNTYPPLSMDAIISKIFGMLSCLVVIFALVGWTQAIARSGMLDAGQSLNLAMNKYRKWQTSIDKSYTGCFEEMIFFVKHKHELSYLKTESTTACNELHKASQSQSEQAPNSMCPSFMEYHGVIYANISYMRTYISYILNIPEFVYTYVKYVYKIRVYVYANISMHSL